MTCAIKLCTHDLWNKLSLNSDLPVRRTDTDKWWDIHLCVQTSTLKVHQHVVISYNIYVGRERGITTLCSTYFLHKVTDNLLHTFINADLSSFHGHLWFLRLLIGRVNTSEPCWINMYSFTDLNFYETQVQHLTLLRQVLIYLRT